MKNPNLAHVAAGDRVLAGGVETNIAAVLADSAKLADGRVLSERDFFADDLLVIPKEAPPEVTALIAAQPARLAKKLVAVRCLCGRDEPTFTIAHRRTGERLHCAVHSEEGAEVSFCTPRWEEGKPALNECWTEYFVGGEKIEVPDDFEPERYS